MARNMADCLAVTKIMTIFAADLKKKPPCGKNKQNDLKKWKRKSKYSLALRDKTARA